jgi:hypothetical protein
MAMARRLLLVPLAASLLVSVAACGSSTPSSAVLLRDAQAAFDSASSVKVSGVVPVKGQSYRVDLSMSASGNLSGTISTPVQQIKLITVDGTGYQYVTREFFGELVQLQQVPASMCKLICDKYLKEPPSGQDPPFTLASMISLFRAAMPQVSKTVTPTTYDGQPAYELTQPDGSRAFIARQGQHHVLGIASKDGKLTFSEWNSVPAIVAPPASQVASLPSGL